MIPDMTILQDTQPVAPCVCPPWHPGVSPCHHQGHREPSAASPGQTMVDTGGGGGRGGGGEEGGGGFLGCSADNPGPYLNFRHHMLPVRVLSSPRSS